MADLGEEAFSSQMKVVATFLRLLEELMRNKQQDLRYGTKTQRRGILGRMKDFVGGIFKKVYDGTFGRLSRNGKDYGQLDLNDPAVATILFPILDNCDILMCILAEQAGNRKYQTSTLQKPLSRKLRIWNLGENARLRCSVIFVAPNFLVMEISEQRNS